MHHDEVTEIEIKRAKKAGYPIIGGDLTFILFLNRNDEFEGGEIQFANHSLHRTPDIGDILFFQQLEIFHTWLQKLTLPSDIQPFFEPLFTCLKSNHWHRYISQATFVGYSRWILIAQ